MILLFGGVIAVVVYEMIRDDKVGRNAWLPIKVLDVAGVDPRSVFENPENPGGTDPALPSFDEAYRDPGLLEEFGVDGMMFEEYAARTYVRKGRAGRGRRVVTGIYARVYVLDHDGEYRTLASKDWLGSRDISVELQDHARDLAGRLGVPFQTI